jgi:TetR/AcrR family transcriptional repressor of nem operon
MPLSKQHKQQTRERIVKTASRALRAEGIDGVSIPALMRRAGLTHGGFYAHFPSKDALVAEACALGLVESSERLGAAASHAPPGQHLRAIVDAYLTPEHRDAPATGCVIAALAPQLIRAPADVRASFAAALDQSIDRLSAYLPGASERACRDNARLLLAGMVGTLVMARAMDDRDESDRLLALAREFYARAFAAGGE